MTDLQRYIRGDIDSLPPDALDKLIERYPWFSLARAIRLAATGRDDATMRILSGNRIVSAANRRKVDLESLVRLTDDDLIDRFLKIGDYRIVSDETESAEDIRTESSHEGEEEMVSEDLAEIYLAQGLYGQAIDIYRKLSLLNSEKSVYFAELIAQIETKTKNN